MRRVLLLALACVLVAASPLAPVGATTREHGAGAAVPTPGAVALVVPARDGGVFSGGFEYVLKEHSPAPFGVAGTVDLPAGTEARALVEAPNGDVIVGVTPDDVGADARSSVLRFDASGAPAPGWTPPVITSGTDDPEFVRGAVVALAAEADGRVWVFTEISTATGPDGSFLTSVVVQRLAPDGAVDETFGGGTEISAFGRLLRPLPPVGDGAVGIVIASPQNVLAPDGPEVVSVRRFGPTGTFLGSQPVLATATDDAVVDPHVSDRAGGGFLASGILADGRVVLAGLAPGLGPDTTFGVAGYYVTDLVLSSPGSLARGRLVPLDVSGPFTFLDRDVLVRVQANGYEDTRFGRPFVSVGPALPRPLLGTGTWGFVDANGGRGVAVADLPATPDVCPLEDGPGYWMAAADGAVYAFGAARYRGRMVVQPGNRPVADLAAHPGCGGYWLADDGGSVVSFAPPLDPPDRRRWAPDERLVALSPTPSGNGAFWFTTRGRVLSQGGAPGLGDMAGARLTGPVLDGVGTTTGRGYWMVGSDGGVFSFGDARFHGSMGGVPLSAPVQTLVPTPSGRGYWLVASDGGVFAFGDAPYLGSMGGTTLNQPIVGAVAYGRGYLLVAADGGIFNFSDQPFLGSLGGSPPATPVVAVAAVP